MAKEKVVKELEMWMELSVILDAVVEVVSEFGEVALDDAQEIYLDFIENELYDALRQGAKAYYSKKAE